MARFAHGPRRHARGERADATQELLGDPRRHDGRHRSADRHPEPAVGGHRSGRRRRGVRRFRLGVDPTGDRAGSPGAGDRGGDPHGRRPGVGIVGPPRRSGGDRGRRDGHHLGEGPADRRRHRLPQSTAPGHLDPATDAGRARGSRHHERPGPTAFRCPVPDDRRPRPDRPGPGSAAGLGHGAQHPPAVAAPAVRLMGAQRRHRGEDESGGGGAAGHDRSTIVAVGEVDRGRARRRSSTVPRWSPRRSSPRSSRGPTCSARSSRRRWRRASDG